MQSKIRIINFFSPFVFSQQFWAFGGKSSIEREKDTNWKFLWLKFFGTASYFFLDVDGKRVKFLISEKKGERPREGKNYKEIV